MVGLGNPGEEYASSRHNVGFQAVDALAAAGGFPPFHRKRQVQWSESKSEGRWLILVKPQGFMNLSGGTLCEFLSNHPAGKRILDAVAEDREDELTMLPDRLIVVHDDLDLPLGKLRYRSQGSSGGHRGVASVIDVLGTSRFARLRVGIGRREGVDAASYVLQPLRGAEEKFLKEVAAHAAGTLRTWILEGAEACARRFNGPSGELPEGPRV